MSLKVNSLGVLLILYNFSCVKKKVKLIAISKKTGPTRGGVSALNSVAEKLKMHTQVPKAILKKQNLKSLIFCFMRALLFKK